MDGFIKVCGRGTTGVSQGKASSAKKASGSADPASMEALWEKAVRTSDRDLDKLAEIIDRKLSLNASSKDENWLKDVEAQATALYKAAGNVPVIPASAKERYARFTGDKNTREIIGAGKGKISDNAIRETFGGENPVGLASFRASETHGSAAKIVESWAKGLGQTGWNKANPRQRAMIVKELNVGSLKDLGIQFN